MSFKFSSIADQSELPTTPNCHDLEGKSSYKDKPSTTPQVPPPNSTTLIGATGNTNISHFFNTNSSFEPFGTSPSDSSVFGHRSFLASAPVSRPSTLPGAPPTSANMFSGSNAFGSGSAPSSNNLFGSPVSKPLAHTRSTHKPSSLSRSFRADSTDDEEETKPQIVPEPQQPPKKNPSGTFALDALLADESDGSDEDEEEDAEGEYDDYENEQYNNNNNDGYDNQDVEDEDKKPVNEMDAAMDQLLEREINAHYENANDRSDDDDEDDQDDAEGEEEEEDMFMSMRHRENDFNFDEEVVEDLLLATPAATKRMRKEAESLARASRVTPDKQDFQYAQSCKDIYTQLGFAILNETPDLILKTEELITGLYDDGVGPVDDPQKLDKSMADNAIALVQLWNAYARDLPSEEESDLIIGPGEDADPFRKASWVAYLLLVVHHSRYNGDFMAGEVVPLPEALFTWLDQEHNSDVPQLQQIMDHRPSPASHTLFWQTLRTMLIRGQITIVIDMFKNAGWEQVQKRSGTYEYSGRVLDNIKHAVQDTIEMLNECPGATGNWNVFGSEWTLFRVKARSAWERLSRFAEGRGRNHGGYNDAAFGAVDSMTGLSRQAESLVPWDIYEQLNMVFNIVQGDEKSILQTAQDWLEATIGICGWWDQEIDHRGMLRPNVGLNKPVADQQSYANRLAAAFHVSVAEEFDLQIMNHCEVAAAAIFEGNYTAAIGFLRGWSLPIAAAAAEFGTLAQWLPKREIRAPKAMDDFDDMDLEVLGMAKQGPDEIDGIKDTTLVQYARELAGIDMISDHEYGWEVATRVLGRLDSVTLAEKTIGELLHDVLENIDVNSSDCVERVWRILIDLGMTNFAEESAETFADLLSRDSNKYGEALWYYSLAHKTNKVREVLNLLISYSLVQSTAFPLEEDLDERLELLLEDRSATLEILAKQDVDAAQLLGCMLAGYATLRKYYSLRDSSLTVAPGSTRALTIKKQAAAALVAVIASSSDNIRSGIYDASSDAVVSEDFLLALLGEALVLIGSSSVLITPEQMDTILKAIEDLQTVGDCVFTVCKNFFDVVLAATPGGLKGSKPEDLLASTANSLGGSLALAPSSVIASQLHRSVSATCGANAAALAGVERGWDWRTGLQAGMTAEDVLKFLRLGLAKDLAKCWLQEADDVVVF